LCIFNTYDRILNEFFTYLSQKRKVVIDPKDILMKNFFVFVILALFFSCSDSTNRSIPPPEVTVTLPIQDSVPVIKEFVGQVYGYVDIPIRARVEGYLEKIHFNEGRGVEKGQLLYTIDDQPFQASVAQNQSHLAEAKIQAANALNELERIKPLAKINAVSQRDLDNAETQEAASRAAVEAAEAQLRLSKIELSYANIRSPIKGLIGKSEADVGEFVGRTPNPVILNTVSKLDSVRVEFFISENDYLQLARKYGTGQERRENQPDMFLVFSDQTVYKYPGKVNFVDREIDPETGALLIQSTFPNPDRLIRPGQFAKVRTEIYSIPNALLVPQRAVKQFQGVSSVFVVEADSTVQEITVELGPTYKDYWVVNRGLKSDQKVVYEGILKVASGAKVRIKEEEFKSNVVQE
jgi:membrane fusion protein (multidrug efflux system)